MIDDLVRQGLIKRHVIDEKAVSDALALSIRDLKIASIVLQADSDWGIQLHIMQCFRQDAL
ncbi:MAG: hypothetical protein D5R96_05610 [Methanocalculus sp. MSAO_Arc2]|uniref:hypothetical protein n=1 Tax=Methanocalculus sp. MSAO_Arc2 TaxID=2293855 RepID=UPI000FF12E6A|nr:MAG: hypothetical protein D5R96_05610 [Methanocalculus sp. MSAO_Arc2]